MTDEQIENDFLDQVLPGYSKKQFEYLAKRIQKYSKLRFIPIENLADTLKLEWVIENWNKIETK